MRNIQIIKISIILTVGILFFQSAYGQRKRSIEKVETIQLNQKGKGAELKLTVTAGKSHNYPMMAAWMEDMEGNFIQTIYVNESVAKGYFSFAVQRKGKWEPGQTVRPAALPVWAHSRGIKSEDGHFMPTSDNPIPDAYTSATPKHGFVLEAKTDEVSSGTVKIFFEINQSWDWNKYWTNNKFPDDEDYKSSAQPSVVYAATIELEKPGFYELTAIGHGHYSGQTGEINPDLSTITTALEIVSSVTLEVK